MNKKRIYIVDDNEMNRELLAEILGDEYELDFAADGEECIHTLSQKINEFDLMLLDIVMPKVDGFQVLEKMNETGWIKSLPVVLISVEYSPTHIDKAFDLGAFDFINRPFDISVVKRRVRNAMLFKNIPSDEGELHFMSVDTEF